MFARKCVYVWWELRSSTNESPWRTCQAEKWSSVLGSVACRSKACLLMWHSVSPAETSQGSSNSGRWSRAELHIPAKLLLLDAAEGLSWLWCRYLQNSQLLKSGAKLLSRGKTSVLFYQNHSGFCRPLRTESHETSVQPFIWTHHCSGHFASCFTGLCHRQQVILASTLRFWVSHKPQWDSLHAEALLCSICISLKSHQPSYLYIPLPVSTLCIVSLLLFFPHNLTFSSFTPLLLPVKLRAAFLFYQSLLLLTSCSLVHLCSANSCITMTTLLSLCELACEPRPVWRR